MATEPGGSRLARQAGPLPSRARMQAVARRTRSDATGEHAPDLFSVDPAGFAEEARHYWLEERGVSLRLSARIVQAIEALDSGRLVCRYLHGSSRLHAKIYLGRAAATLGSSNFTSAGLSDQVEVNARFEHGSEPDRYEELSAIAENLWSAGSDWSAELRALLEQLLQVVDWQEALARAAAELLEGEWAARYVAEGDAGGSPLWPSQRAGIAQALWVTKDVGSVLVADATGSGKTRMGAHLVRAVRDRLWSTGQIRRDLSVLVSPPSVEETWKREAVACGLTLETTSQCLLSRASAEGPRPEEEAVARAHILAVDEAHNFLNRDAARTRQVRASRADHVLLFTATPINRGARDLLAFGQHPVTLAVLATGLREPGVDSMVAIGGDDRGKRRVVRRFAPSAAGRAVALCSDALNEGLNLQGASALVHLDLPTTLRVAEQRVGRVDRMDSPHDSIEVWWPRDGAAFATRANELIVQRSVENAQLLGSNLHVPELSAGGLFAGGRSAGIASDGYPSDGNPSAGVRATGQLDEQIAAAEEPEAERWDGISDALDPVRQLVGGTDPLIAPALYEQLRRARHRIVARVSPVRSRRPWVFLAVAGSSDGAPRWHFLDGVDLRPTTDLDTVCRRLREELRSIPEASPLDDGAWAVLDRALDVAARNEIGLLPRRMRRALEQMSVVLESWEDAARRRGDEAAARTLRELAGLANPGRGNRGGLGGLGGLGRASTDPYLVAERWLAVTAEIREGWRERHRHKPFVLPSDVTAELVASPILVASLAEAFDGLPVLPPLEERVTACILGVPGA